MSTYSSHLIRTLSLVLAITSLVLLIFAGVAAAQASSDRILSADQYTSEPAAGPEPRRGAARTERGCVPLPALARGAEAEYPLLPAQGRATGRSIPVDAGVHRAGSLAAVLKAA